MKSNQKIANRIKKKHDLYPKKINNTKYMLSYESNYFIARVYQHNICDEMFLMSEEFFVTKFLNGHELQRNHRISGDILRRDYNIYAPNDTYGYLNI